MLILVGGGYGGSHLPTTEILSLDTMTFTPGPSMAYEREGRTVVVLDEHRIMLGALSLRGSEFAQHVLIIGGEEAEDTTLATTELLDAATMEFAPGPAMLAGRDRFAAIRLDAERARRRRVADLEAVCAEWAAHFGPRADGRGRLDDAQGALGLEARDARVRLRAMRARARTPPPPNAQGLGGTASDRTALKLHRT
ncbi:hypothetical protein M885DRAFT_609872 [Pelagophyceae sp. CCMP2097]|nr:hypothetical protein M885DRAFT_609872 [Pelagophyceae sp. CCMP2097]